MSASILPPHYSDEAERLSALRRYDILDTPPERTFDLITGMAARIFSVPIAVISMVDESRIWFKSHHGLNVGQIAREPGLCASAIMQQEPWILGDARRDSRSRYNPLVTSDFGLQFYAGVPLRTPDGFNIGMLCVLDMCPHEVTDAQITDLQDLAAIVMEQMELRLATRRAMASTARLASERETAYELAELIAREYSDSVETSLELITGILRRQSLEGPGHRELDITANRVAVIRRAHQHISDSGGSACAAAFLTSLCDSLLDAPANDAVDDIRVDGAPLTVGSRPLIAIGLIVNELIAAAVRRGAADIRVALKAEPGGYALSVRDDGEALPTGFDPADDGDLGMKIVLGQIQYIGGKLLVGTADGADGASFTILFAPASLA